MIKNVGHFFLLEKLTFIIFKINKKSMLYDAHRDFYSQYSRTIKDS